MGLLFKKVKYSKTDNDFIKNIFLIFIWKSLIQLSKDLLVKIIKTTTKLNSVVVLAVRD